VWRSSAPPLHEREFIARRRLEVVLAAQQKGLLAEMRGLRMLLFDRFEMHDSEVKNRRWFEHAEQRERHHFEQSHGVQRNEYRGRAAVASAAKSELENIQTRCTRDAARIHEAVEGLADEIALEASYRAVLHRREHADFTHIFSVPGAGTTLDDGA
jgi:cell division protein FtsB